MMHWIIRILRWLLLLLALIGVVATILPFLPQDTWWIRALDLPRLELLVAMVLVGLALALVSPRNAINWVMIVTLLLSVSYDAFLLLPFSPVVSLQVAHADACPQESRLRLFEVNVQMTNRHDDRLLDMVRKAAPDVAWFQETDDWWEHELAPLGSDMPFDIAQTQPNYYGVHLYSRLKLNDPKIHFMTESRNPSVFTDVTLRSGQNVRLYAIHPRPAQVGQSTAERDAQLMTVALAARDDASPHVVAGDMNSVPWEGVIQRTLRIGQFLDPRVGRALDITWNAHSLVLKWPLDQILSDRRLTLLSLQVLPAFGSDHQPLLAEFCVNPGAASSNAALPLRSDDLLIAHAVVEQGQHDADKTGYKGKQ